MIANRIVLLLTAALLIAVFVLVAHRKKAMENENSTRCVLLHVKRLLFSVVIDDCKIPNSFDSAWKKINAVPTELRNSISPLRSDWASRQKDAWYQPLIFRRVSDDRVEIYSIGANGFDDGGANDDILIVVQKPLDCET